MLVQQHAASFANGRPQYGYQILLNGSRLGFYDPIRRLLNRGIGRDPDQVLASTALLAGALTGCIGGESSTVTFHDFIPIDQVFPSF